VFFLWFIAEVAVLLGALSFIIGYAAERSRSVIVAVSLHMYIDLLLNNLDLYVPMLLALPIWALLLLTWPKAKATASMITSNAGFE